MHTKYTFELSVAFLSCDKVFAFFNSGSTCGASVSQLEITSSGDSSRFRLLPSLEPLVLSGVFLACLINREHFQLW